jgi:hypothetical protein
MRILPLLTEELTAARPLPAVAAALRATIGDRHAPGGLPFSGRVTEDGFVITRFNEYRSTFMPHVRGRFRAAPAGTSIRVILRPHWSVFVFMAIWLLFLAGFAAIIVATRWMDPSRSLLPLLVPGGLAAFSWFLVVGVFAADARWALLQLREKIPGLPPG